MSTTDDLIEVAAHFIVAPAKNGEDHHIFASDGTFNIPVKTFPASESEDTVVSSAQHMANGREVRVERDFDPADLSRFFNS